MARIVIDAREFTTTTGRYVYRLVQYLQEIDAKNEYIILLQPHDAKNWQPKAPNFEVVETKYKEFTFAEQLGFAWQLYRLKADLVHFGMVQQPLLYFKRSVTTMHDLITVRFRNPTKNPVVFWIKQQVYKLVNIWAPHKNKFIIVPTNFVKQDVANYSKVSPDKIVVTYESADYISDKPEPVKELINQDFIMYLGRPLPHKNLGRLIQAYAVLRKKHPKLKLAIAGKKGPMHNLHIKTATDLGVIDGVVFTGFVTEGQMKWMFEHVMSYVFPSLSEGFGLPALEAMAHGAPVASSNATCLPEVYGDSAHYFDPLDVNDMANKINDVITDEKLRTSLITKGSKQVSKYSWAKMAKETHKIYLDALK
jgi:glycosyltransferase involved in cell wall biosynthesis